VLLSQTAAARRDFWIAPPTTAVILGCFAGPFAMKFWITSTSIPMIVIVYAIIAWKVVDALRGRLGEHDWILGPAAVMFLGTLLTALVLSLTLRPILTPKYVMTIVPLLMLPPALFLSGIGLRLLKILVGGLLVSCGVYNAFIASYISMGPYGQAVEVLRAAHPGVGKILHTIELTPGPILEFTRGHALRNYWLGNERAVSYTNLNAFDDLERVTSLNEALVAGELFCLIVFENSPLNRENTALVLSSSRMVSTERVKDRKGGAGVVLVLYVLRYEGAAHSPPPS
jgi:hypothetical protein